jgi:hypothetical protein
MNDIQTILNAMNQVAIELISCTKQANTEADIEKLLTDAMSNTSLQSAVKSAIAAAKNLPADLKTLTAEEAITLAISEVSQIPSIISALKS